MLRSRFRVSDLAFVDGRWLTTSDQRFLDAQRHPKDALDPTTLEKLRSADDPRFRVYKRIAFYDGLRDVGLMTFLRLQHRGPFTFIESTGVRLMPVVDRLFGQYSERPTTLELEHETDEPPSNTGFYTAHTVGAILVFALLTFA